MAKQMRIVRVRQILSIAAALLMFQSVTLMQQSAALASTQIQGAGATFPYPLYSKWFAEFQKVDSSVEINYQSIGSGGGINQLLKGTVDFGASDAPMSNEEMAKSAVPIVHIPTVLGAVVLTYNLPDVKSPLKLTPDVVAQIFLGKITKWDDAKIAANNPGVKLPGLPVLPVYRADGSGTTAIFTDYLVKVSSEFKQSPGAGKAVKWPAGLGGKGNEGVTGVVKQTPGAIGYVELVYAKSNKMAVAEIKNAAGQFVMPTLDSVTAAAQGAMKSMPADYRISITNADGKKSYPISGFTYLLIFQTGKAPKQQLLKKFLGWALTDGQKMASGLDYAPLPQELVTKVSKTAQGLKVE